MTAPPEIRTIAAICQAAPREARERPSPRAWSRWRSGPTPTAPIRVPASLCGVFGLKPTYGRLSRARTFPFVASLDHLGPFARTAGDLALAYDAMLGADPGDPALADVPATPVAPDLAQGIGGMRIGVLGGYFAAGAEPAAFEAVARVAKALGARRTIEFPQADRARAAAYLITMAEGAALHLDRLRRRGGDFDPDVRDRLIAGAMLPGAWIVKAQKFRSWFRAKIGEIMRDVDIVLAPATPCRAPRLGQKTMVLDGREMLVRPNLGLFTQPISFIGLPVATVPVWTAGERLPIGVQIIAAPWREDLVLRAARAWKPKASSARRSQSRRDRKVGSSWTAAPAFLILSRPNWNLSSPMRLMRSREFRF